MKRKKIDCNSAREICLTSLLNNLGYRPKKENAKDAWFLSPFRKETEPSFKISKKLNRWYDHGEGIGGNTIDFVVRLKNCSVKEALINLSDMSFSFQQQNISNEEKQTDFKLQKKQNLQNEILIDYLKSRKITYEIARIYCFEVYYQIDGKSYFGIAFRNDSAGFEIRNKYFKGCFRAKDITSIKNASNTVNVFEGFMDFLSFLHLPNVTISKDDYIILNSLSLVHKTIASLNHYTQVNLYLDNDLAGHKATKALMASIKTECKDCKSLYKNHKDLNDFLKNKQSKSLKPNAKNSDVKSNTKKQRNTKKSNPRKQKKSNTKKQRSTKKTL